MTKRDMYRRQLSARLHLVVLIAATFCGVESVQSAERGEQLIEEVVVSARRREENLQDIPDAVSVFSAQTIEDAGIRTIDDAIAMTPNMDIRNDQQPGVFTLTVRGVSTVRNGQPPVAYVVDGVTLPSSNAFTQELFDIQQIEILKGPQGALYGRNSIGGAINITTKQPDNEFGGYLKAGAGKGDEYSVQSSVSGPVIEDSLFYRLSGYYRDTDGLLDNVYTGKNADWLETKAGRGSILWEPAPDLAVDLRAGIYRSDSGSAYYVPLGIAEPLGPTLPLNTAVDVIQGDKPGKAKVKSADYSLKVDWDTDAGTFTSITAWSDLKETGDQEIDWTPSSYLEGALLTDVRGFTQELRLTSPEEQSLRWFLGLFYQNIDRKRGLNAWINSNAFSGNLNPADKILSPVADELAEQNWESRAIFGQVNYDLTDRLELTVALRYDEFDTNENQILFGNKAPKLDESFNDWQPKMSFAYNWTDSLMSYVTVARGWRPGGFNLPNRLDITAYDEEALWNYEVGFKSSFVDNRITVNGSAFYIDYDDQQFFLLTSNAGGGPVQLLVNGKKSRIVGMELDMTASLTDRLVVTAGLGLVDDEIRSVGPEITNPFPETKPGNNLPNTADLTANLSAQYSLPLGNELTLISRVDYSRLGKTYWTLDNVLSEKPYDIVDIRLSLEWERWKLTALVENAFDEDYYSQVFDQRWSGFVTDTGWPSRPRYYGVEARVDF